MRNILFVVGHLFSGSSDLIRVLNKNPRIEIRDLGLSYDHPTTLDYLFSLGHKLDNTAAIYGDHNLFNKDFCCKSLYNFSKFIYVIRPAKPTLNEIILHRKEYSELTAARYYSFRLRRMYEMAVHTPGAIMLTWDDLAAGRGADLIEDYLSLKEHLSFDRLENQAPDDYRSKTLLDSSQDCYEKYLYYFKNIELRTLA